VQQSVALFAGTRSSSPLWVSLILLGIFQIELMKFALEELLVGELWLVFSNKGWRERAAQGVLYDFIIFAGTSRTPMEGRS
jgi:hypothetical protein